MQINDIERIIQLPRWSEKQLERAARGKVNGSCEDPPEIELEFWKNIELGRADKLGRSVEEVVDELRARALRGEFR